MLIYYLETLMKRNNKLFTEDRIFKIAQFVIANDSQYGSVYKSFLEDMPTTIRLMVAHKYAFEGMHRNIYWRVKFFAEDEESAECVVLTKIKDGKKEVMEIQYGDLSYDSYKEFPVGYGLMLYRQVFTEDTNSPDEEFSYFDYMSYKTEQKKGELVLERSGFSMLKNSSDYKIIKPKIRYEKLLSVLRPQSYYDKIKLEPDEIRPHFEQDPNLFGDTLLMKPYEPYELRYYEAFKEQFDEARRNDMLDGFAK